MKINLVKNTIKKAITARNIFMLLGMLFIFFVALRPPTDPDLGWHLRDGSYLRENNFRAAKTDIFSYTMPNFPLVMHEWATDIGMESIYRHFGFAMLSIIFALITATAFLLAAMGTKSSIEYKIIAASLGILASVPILGIRPQMLSLLGLALVIFIIFKFRENPKTRIIYWLPLVFFIWVNMHAGFSVGLFFLGVFIGIETIKLWFLVFLKKYAKERFIKIRIKLEENIIQGKYTARIFFIFIISFLSTFINPYGWRVYVEVFTTIFDQYARQIIGEWLPVDMANPMSYQFIIYLALLAILLLMNRKKNDYTYLTIALVFLALAFRSWRHMPVFIIVSIPLWVGIVEFLAGKELLKIIEKKIILFFAVLAVAIVGTSQLKIVLPLYNSLERISEAGAYPLGAVKYLKANPISGNMFNEYNWGGFLDWQYPQKKVFIDGRMPSWKMGDQKVFEEFNESMKFGPGWSNILDKYEVNFALVYNNQANEINFLNLGWQEVFRDNMSLIFVRKE